MKFELIFDAQEFDITYGEPGTELSCFVPDGLKWKQLNFTYGEGKVDVAGNEWGFSYSENGGFYVILHKGNATPQAATAFVEQVKLKLFADRSALCKVVRVSEDT